jgi:hypothetical protein
MSGQAGLFAAVFVTLYAAHHVGDYWVQTDHQALHKGDAGWSGRAACLKHVLTYVWTQAVMLGLLFAVLGIPITWGVHAGLLISGVTHYLADRREHGLMFKLARRLPGKAAFLELGRPRDAQAEVRYRLDGSVIGGGINTVPLDNPQLATGAWALDQAWHIFWGVFVAALLVVAL